MLRQTAVFGVVVVLAATFLTGCGMRGTQRDSLTISVAEATNVLQNTQEAAAIGDMQKLCAIGDSPERCKDEWNASGGVDAVPSTAPVIVDTRLIPTRQLSNGDWEIGGRVLVLQGEDGLGRKYCTDFLVFAPNGRRLVPFYPVYWSGLAVAQRNPDGTMDSAAQPKRPCDS